MIPARNSTRLRNSLGQARQARYPSLHLSWRRRSQYAQHKRSSGGSRLLHSPFSRLVFSVRISDFRRNRMFSYMTSCRLRNAILKRMYFLTERGISRQQTAFGGGARAEVWPRAAAREQRGQGRLRNLSAMSLGGNVGFVGDRGTLATGILRPAPRRPSCGPCCKV